MKKTLQNKRKCDMISLCRGIISGLACFAWSVLIKPFLLVAGAAFFIYQNILNLRIILQIVNMPPVPLGDIDTHQIPQLRQRCRNRPETVVIKCGYAAALIGYAQIISRTDKCPVSAFLIEKNTEIFINIKGT